MDHSRTAACKKHAGKAVSELLGRRPNKNVRISDVSDPSVNRGAYFCYCGQPADFFFREITDDQIAPSGSETKENPNTNRVNSRGTPSGDDSRGVRGRIKSVK